MKTKLVYILLIGLFSLLVFTSCITNQGPTPTPIIPTITATNTPLPKLNLSKNKTPISCADAANYYGNGNAEMAYQAYEAILATDALMGCAFEGQATLAYLLATQTPISTPTPTITPNAVVVVPGLIQIGDYAGAWEKAKTSINDDPAIANSINDITYIRFIKTKNWITEYFVPVGSLALVIGIIILAIIFLVKRYLSIQLDLQDFTSGTYYIDETKKGSLGKSITARIELILKQKFDNPQNSTKGLVNTPINPPELPGSVPASISGFWTFISKLIPPRVIVVEGLLENNQEKQLGLSVKIIDERSQGFIGHAVFWAKDFNLECKKSYPASDSIVTEKAYSKSKTIEPENVSKTTEVNSKKETISPESGSEVLLTDNFFILADLAAAWIFWTYCEIQEFNLRQIFGTDNFESYKWDYLSKKTGHEEDFLNKAVANDNKNAFALLNLGHYLYEKSRILYKEKTNENRGIFQRQAYKYLIEVLNLTNQDELPSINANYNLGCLVHESDFSPDDKDDIKTCEEYFEDAYKYINVTKAHVSPNLEHSLMLPHLYFEIINGSVKAAEKLHNIEKTPGLSGETLYNLACTYGKFMTLSEQKLVNKNKAFGFQEDRPSGEKETPAVDLEKDLHKKRAEALVKKESEIAWDYFKLALLSLPDLMDEYRNGKVDDWLVPLLKMHKKEMEDLLKEDKSSEMK